ncbi:hypothetical protein [Actinomadura litoris]|uniref:hypothetical protein n=1 Tax=Actinomadura litoris TaxID=2678616 RepID=UPI001FA80932|nr:hypothetical protein [Actinomadura litoris]
MGTHAGRKGRRWRKVRAAVLAESTLCWLCGHEGSGSVDHDPPLLELRAHGLDPEDRRYLRPAHGALSRCPTCNRACNEAKGAREHVPERTNSRAW